MSAPFRPPLRRRPRSPGPRSTSPRRILDGLAAGLLTVGSWSFVGALLAFRLRDPEAAWDFLFALAGCGLTLCAIGLLEDRAHGRD